MTIDRDELHGDDPLFVEDRPLIERLREGANDLTPYCLGEESSPTIHCALPATLNEAADQLSAKDAENTKLRSALTRALWYVEDHNDSQPNDQTTDDLEAVERALND